MNSFFSSALSVAGIVSLVSVVAGCADAGIDANEPDTDSAAAEIGVHNPSGVYVASVTASGSGCPAGTYDASISRDGKDVKITFSSYEAELEPGQSFSVKDCSIGFDLRTPNDLSFAVRSFSFDGSAELDRGTKAAVTAKYYFSGNPMASKEQRQNLVGPFDDDILFAENLPANDLTWSPCGRTRRLNLQTRVFAQNDRQRTGSAKVTLGAHEMSLRLNLAWRHC